MIFKDYAYSARCIDSKTRITSYRWGGFRSVPQLLNIWVEIILGSFSHDLGFVYIYSYTSISDNSVKQTNKEGPDQIL